VTAAVDWARLEVAYLIGLHRPADRTDVFGTALGALVARRLEPADHARVRAGWAAIRQALAAARRRATARVELELARAVAAQQDAAGATESWLLIESNLGAVEAYTRAADEEWDAATAALGRALHADARLRDLGYAVLEMHRVQLAHNSARIAARRGAVDDAVETLAGLAGYLRGATPWPLDDGRADPLALLDQPPGLVDAMQAQVTGELGLIVARDDDRPAGLVLASLERALGPAEPRSQRALDVWRRMLAARSSGDLVSFTADAGTMFRRGPHGRAVLWHLTALDVLDAARSAGGADPAATALARTLDRHSGPRSDAPRSVRAAHRTTRNRLVGP